MKAVRYRGDTCRHRRNLGPTMVPYGEGSVPLGYDDYGCVLGYDANVCDCPPGTEEPEDARYVPGLKWDTWDDDDRAYDLWRDN